MQTPSYYDRRRKTRRINLFTKPRLALWAAALVAAIALGSAISDRADERALMQGEETSQKVAALLAAARTEAPGGQESDEAEKQGRRKSARANLEKALGLMRGNDILESHPAYIAALSDLAAVILAETGPTASELQAAIKLLDEAWGRANNKIAGEVQIVAADKKLRARIARDRGLAELLADNPAEARKWYETAKELGAQDRVIIERLELLDNLERWNKQ
jgi:hypothetical protein